MLWYRHYLQNYPGLFKLPVEGQLASERKVQRNTDGTPHLMEKSPVARITKSAFNNEPANGRGSEIVFYVGKKTLIKY